MILADAWAAVSVGKPATPEYNFIPDAMAIIGSCFDVRDMHILQTELKQFLSAQTAHVESTMSFDEYKLFRLKHSGARYRSSSTDTFLRSMCPANEVYCDLGGWQTQ